MSRIQQEVKFGKFKWLFPFCFIPYQKKYNDSFLKRPKTRTVLRLNNKNIFLKTRIWRHVLISSPKASENDGMLFFLNLALQIYHLKKVFFSSKSQICHSTNKALNTPTSSHSDVLWSRYLKRSAHHRNYLWFTIKLLTQNKSK